jgi:hypothetical protein
MARGTLLEVVGYHKIAGARDVTLRDEVHIVSPRRESIIDWLETQNVTVRTSHLRTPMLLVNAR